MTLPIMIAMLLAGSLMVSCAPDSWVDVRTKIADEASKHYQLSLGFAGDICLADDGDTMMYHEGTGFNQISDGIDPRFISIMQEMDLMWINNEFCYSDRGEPLPGKTYVFRSEPSHVTYLDDMGIDIVGLGNNHVYDYGEDAFSDTLATLENDNMPYVGSGRDLEAAKAPVYLHSNGFTIAYVAASRAETEIFTPEATDDSPGILCCYDDDLFLESIREAASRADFVIALPHWGIEHSTELESSQIESAHAYIDAGADAVIGTHPHILQGMEFYEGKPILYSLGNFWFDGFDIDTLVAEIRFTGKRDANGFANLNEADVQVVLHPGTQSECYTSLADTAEWREDIFDHIEYISDDVSIDEAGVLHEA